MWQACNFVKHTHHNFELVHKVRSLHLRNILRSHCMQKGMHSARLSEKNRGASWPQVFIFCRQNKYSGRQKLYLRINGFSFLKDNGLSLLYIFPKNRVTYLGGQVSDQAWKSGRHCVKAGRIGDPTGRNVEPWMQEHWLCFLLAHSVVVPFTPTQHGKLAHRLLHNLEKQWKEQWKFERVPNLFNLNKWLLTPLDQ